MDSLGSRMKSYENETRLPKGAVIIRVDGKAFHTWTKQLGIARPFDEYLNIAMVAAMGITASEMQGFRLAYTQSDECSFLLANPGENEGGWFDYKLQKLCSLTASIFTYEFNMHMVGRNLNRAVFDARAFNIPVEDAANAFVWREQDNKRNYVQAYAHSLMSHGEIQNKSNAELVDQLRTKGYDPYDLPGWVRHGTFMDRDGKLYQEELGYQGINALAGLKELVDATSQG
jgi:tRNA(His) guanylyltransferase